METIKTAVATPGKQGTSPKKKKKKSISLIVTVKVESGISLTSSQTAELQFLRSRVRELEREKAVMGAENQRLRNMLVNEIPGLLSTMWQTLGQANHPHASPTSISMAIGRGDDYTSYQHHQPMTNHSSQGGDYSPPGHTHSYPLPNHSALGHEDLNGDMSDYGAPISSGEEEVTGGDMGLGGDIGGEVPMCSQTDLAEMRRRCSESSCANGDANSHVNFVEVFPGSGVLCDMRSWNAANQAQSATAMARTLLLGVFDMDTLMNSNLRGGRSRRAAFHPQRSALDPHKINAIFNATLSRFPLARKGVIGTGINSKLSEIRFHMRRANREPKFP
ncbi:uncharacterized protein LOC130123224 [Lampris incognitus]|uniref:uncharacterized protein LOC130123224 n=1 Tax=Lampris incognitus TaxID=2546036 RepID=UPI0024B59703|nr:uncharacterized protein LOC130123224 [Lampris incognitus]